MTSAEPFLFTRRSLLGMAMAAAGVGAGLAGTRLRAQGGLEGGSVAATARKLRPGQFLWAPEVAPEGPVIIVVSLGTQRAYVYRNGVLIGISTVSTGAPGHETPVGVFTILQKKVDHRSNLYNDAPMPFMQRLTWDGIAMHAGNLPGYPASHGCIRLPLAFAKHLYDVTALGLTVIITRSTRVPRFAPVAGILKNAAPAATARDSSAATWEPEKAPAGPVSIIISAADRRAVVLRNGIEIGSTPIAIRGRVDGLEAFTLAAIDAQGTHWMFLAISGSSRKGEVTQQDRDRLTMAGDFREKLLAILQPGATLIVTTDSLNAGSTGAPLTILTGEDPG